MSIKVTLAFSEGCFRSECPATEQSEMSVLTFVAVQCQERKKTTGWKCKVLPAKKLFLSHEITELNKTVFP